MKRPIVGIVMKHLFHDAGRPDMFIRDEVKQAVFNNGGIAIGITLPKDERLTVGDDWADNFTSEEKEQLIIQIRLCDGIVFQGGRVSDNYEMIVAKYCYENDIPTLGICAGQNTLVRALSGTTMKVSNPEKHDRSFDDYVHGIKINRGSKFYKIVGTEEMMVNSRHRNTVDTCPGLEKVAFCEDGYADVVEAPDKKFYIGVRFHPESLYKKDEKMNAIFAEFIKVCKL